MDLIEFREYCLSLDDVTEKMPFGKFARRYESVLAFYVLGHMFCFIDIEDFSFVDVKSTPAEVDELRSRYSSTDNPVNQSLRHWIKLTFNGDIPDHTIYETVKRAYEIVYSKYSKRTTSRDTTPLKLK